MDNPKVMIWMFLGVVCAIVAVYAALYVFILKRPNPPLAKNEVKIDNAVFDVEIASTSVTQVRGLSFRDSLPDGDGMLFIFSRPSIQKFWMKNMQFPLDIIWIGGDRVLGFAENALPEPGVPLRNLKIFNSPNGTDKVLEVNAGTVAKYHMKIGDAVTLGI